MEKFNIPYCDNFLIQAAKVNQTEAMEYILRYQEKKEPTKTKRFHAIYEVSQHSSTKRFHLFDGVNGTVLSYNVAHGSGSEGDKNDGWANTFSNKSGSNATSLGLYKCAETYIGKHGRSMRLDGLESTNSNARDRAIVIHGASYVYENYAGDSQGCPALPDNKVQYVIDCLREGSFLLIYLRGKLPDQTGVGGLLNDLVNVVTTPPPFDNTKDKGKKLLWYPKAIRREDLRMHSKGSYATKSGLSCGTVFHYDAGNFRKKPPQNILGTIEWGRGMGFLFGGIDVDGTIIQTNPLNQWSNHAGISSWIINGKRQHELSDYLDGMETSNPGRLTLYKGQYYAEEIDVKRDEKGKILAVKNPIDTTSIRFIKKKIDNRQVGAYIPFTKELEEAFIDRCVWRKFNDPEVYKFEYILGHDEIAGVAGIGYDRKPDPGGALSMSMAELRGLVQKRYESKYGKD